MENEIRPIIIDESSNLSQDDSNTEELDFDEETLEYDPNVDDSDIEDVQLDTEPIGTFRIDENMPDELKAQLMKFNQKAINLNKINSGTDPELIGYEQSNYIEEDDSDDSLEDDDSSIDILEEDDGSEIGNIF